MSEIGEQPQEQTPAPRKKRKPRSDKGRPRPRQAQTSAQDRIPTEPDLSRTERAHANDERPARVPMNNSQTKLDRIARPYMRDGYKMRWLSDQEGRLAQAESAWMAPVKDEQGRHVTYQKGLRTMHLYEMEEWIYDEEAQLAEDRTVDIMTAENRVGKDQYVPDGQSTPLSRDPTHYTHD